MNSEEMLRNCLLLFTPCCYCNVTSQAEKFIVVNIVITEFKKDMTQTMGEKYRPDVQLASWTKPRILPGATQSAPPPDDTDQAAPSGARLVVTPAALQTPNANEDDEKKMSRRSFLRFLSTTAVVAAVAPHAGGSSPDRDRRGHVAVLVT